MEAKKPLRVLVLIDAQNVYRDARRAFFNDTGPSTGGQTDVSKYSKLLVERVAEHVKRDTELAEVRVYAGKPDAAREPVAAASSERQATAWKAAGAVVCLRPLRYPYDWPQTKAQQKGVDVQLSTDLVQLCLRDFYDIAVVASTDTDMRPALESVIEIREKEGKRDYPVVTVVAWNSDALKTRLWLPGRPLYCFHLDRADYESVADATRYGPPKVQTKP